MPLPPIILDDGENWIEFQRRKWEPSVHCSNCRNCIVILKGLKEEEFARCTKDHGKDMPLGRIIRQPWGHGWKQAKNCEDYDSMGD